MATPRSYHYSRPTLGPIAGGRAIFSSTAVAQAAAAAALAIGKAMAGAASGQGAAAGGAAVGKRLAGGATGGGSAAAPLTSGKVLAGVAAAAGIASGALSTPGGTLQADWDARAAIGIASGGWAQLFESDADVSNWRFTNGVGWDPTPAGGSTGSYVRRLAGGGIMGNGCLELEQMTGGNMSSYWQRCFDPAISNWQSNCPNGQRFAHQPFYVQLRFKTNCEGVQGGVGGGGRKLWSVSRMENSYTFQEQVIQDTNYKGVIQGYQGKGDASTYQPYEVAAGGSDFNLQPGSQYSPNGGYCSYQLIADGIRTDSWMSGINVWTTYLMYVEPADHGQSNGRVTVWAHREGMSDYVRIINKLSFYMEYDGDKAAAFNAFLAWMYETGRTSGLAGLKQWYDQIIYSRATAGQTPGPGADGWIPAPAVASSALATLVSSMAPGTWAQLTGISNQNAVLGVGDQNGTMLPQTNKAFWCPQLNTIEVVAQDHGGGGGLGWGMRHASYSLASNGFSLVEASSALHEMGHSYDHTAINPFTGDLYSRVYALGAGTLQILKKPLSARSVWQATVPASATHWYMQVAIGSCWWSGAFNAGTAAGAHGCYMVFNSGAALAPPGASTDGIISGFDPLANSWIYHQDGRAPFYGSGGSGTLHSIMEYSKVKNVAVYGGGNDASRRLWRMNSNGARTELTLVPSGKTVGVGVGSTAGRLIAEPVTGNFLLLCAGQLWELNPDGSGTWTQQTGSRVPPAGVGDPDAGAWVAGVSLPAHGCVAFIRQQSSSSGAFYLYKHA
jgi:hypothetical protein